MTKDFGKDLRIYNGLVISDVIVLAVKILRERCSRWECDGSESTKKLLPGGDRRAEGK